MGELRSSIKCTSGITVNVYEDIVKVIEDGTKELYNLPGYSIIHSAKNNLVLVRTGVRTNDGAILYGNKHGVKLLKDSSDVNYQVLNLADGSLCVGYSVYKNGLFKKSVVFLLSEDKVIFETLDFRVKLFTNFKGNRLIVMANKEDWVNLKEPFKEFGIFDKFIEYNDTLALLSHKIGDDSVTKIDVFGSVNEEGFFFKYLKAGEIHYSCSKKENERTITKNISEEEYSNAYKSFGSKVTRDTKDEMLSPDKVAKLSSCVEGLRKLLLSYNLIGLAMLYDKEGCIYLEIGKKKFKLSNEKFETKGLVLTPKERKIFHKYVYNTVKELVKLPVELKLVAFKVSQDDFTEGYMRDSLEEVGSKEIILK